MDPNPVLKKLGFSNTDRLVILHADDIGMCQASVQAFTDLWEAGGISSGAIMMPCSWAKVAAVYCRAHPGVDMGVHTTLNAEWDTYRWGALSTRDPATGLLDEDGFLFQSPSATQAKASPEAVEAELQLQVQRAIAWGVDVTHVDTHMGTVTHPSFIPAYVQTAIKYHVPIMLPRSNETLQLMGMDTGTAAGFSMLVRSLEEQGMPLLDTFMMMPLDHPEGQAEIAKKLLSEIPSGVTHFLMHPAVDTPELRAIAADWPSRVANYQTFMGKEVSDFIKSAGIQVIGYRCLRDTMKTS